jgi:outer membrane protein
MKRSALTGALAAALLTGTLAGSPAAATTLREALLNAYLENPTLAAARAQQRATDEGVPIESAAGRPSASATATHTEFIRQNPNAFTAPERNLNVGLDLQVPLYQGGAVRNAVRAAEQRVEAGRADLRATETGVFTRAVAAYMDVLAQQAVVALAANQVEVLATNLEATSDRFEIGILTRTDVAQSEARLAAARSDLLAARANLISAREAYISVIGEAPENLQPPPPLPGLPDTSASAVAIALDNNPDLIAARERVEAAGFDIEVAGSGRLPRLSAFVGGNYDNFFGTLGGPFAEGDPNDPDDTGFLQSATTAVAGLQLNIPLFQGGRPAALRRQAQALAGAALEQAVGIERDVIAEVRAAFATYRASLAIIAETRLAIEAAALSLEGVQAEQSIGNRQVLDVLDAEQELLSARVQLIQARRDAYVAGFNLLAAMGRAEARDLGLDGDGVLYDPVVNYERVDNSWFDWARDPDPVASAPSTRDVPAPDAELGPLGDAFELGDPIGEVDALGEIDPGLDAGAMIDGGATLDPRSVQGLDDDTLDSALREGQIEPVEDALETAEPGTARNLPDPDGL